MDLNSARARIEEHADLNAFISVSQEVGDGPAVGVKDLIDVAAMVTTAGGIILPRIPAAEDAPVVRAIRAAGCGVVGKTNLHEFAFGVTNINPHYGTALNPHDRTRVAGGSSGGSAAAVAAGLCDWAIGTDTGGSIRIPASLCGVAGFKPRYGSVDVEGVVPLSRSLDTVGPLAPSIPAAAEAFTWMSGEAVDLRHLTPPKLAVPARWVSGLDAPTAQAWKRVSKAWPEIEFVDRDRLFRAGLTILLFEAAEFHRRWARESPGKYGPDVLALIRRGLDVTPRDYQAALEERNRLEDMAMDAMRGVDALLVPATAMVAPRIDAAGDVREPLARFTRPFNTTRQPVAVLAAPAAGLPVGIQVAGRTNAGTLRAAAWLELEWRNQTPEPAV